MKLYPAHKATDGPLIINEQYQREGRIPEMNNMGSIKPVASLTNRKTTLQIFDVPAKLGRNDNVVDVHFFHNSVSREHCLFECNSRRFTVKDLGSHVGTFINGVQLEPGIPYYIEDGDKITIGQVRFVFNADYTELGKREQDAARSGMQYGMPPAGQPGPSHNMQQGMPQGGFRSDEDARVQNFGGADMQQSSAAGMNSQRPAGSQTGKVFRSPDGKKKAVVSARPLVQFEYDENEVIYIETGLGGAPKKQRYTQDIEKEDILNDFGKEDEVLDAPKMHEAFKPVGSFGEETVIFADPEDPEPEILEDAEPAAAFEEEAEVLEEAEPEGAFEEVPELNNEAAPAAVYGEETVIFADPEDPEPEIFEEAEPEPSVYAEPEFVPEPEDFYEDEPTMVINETIEGEALRRRGPVLRLRWRDEETGETGELLADHFPFYIGRKSGENDFALLKRSMSRRHMGFSERDGAIYVFDENSTNGVRVNGARIEPGYEIRLMKKDIISAGNVSFVVEEVGKAEV